MLTEPDILEQPATARPPTRWWQGAIAGLLAAAVALGVAELVGALLDIESPIVAVGGWVIDHVPPFVKTFAIETFGTNDKPALIVGTLVLLAVFAVVLGIVAIRRRWLGRGRHRLFGVLGAAAALNRPFASARDALPALLGAAAGALALLRRAAIPRGRLRRRPRRARPPALPAERRRGRRGGAVAPRAASGARCGAASA